jgi:tetratricopeptide (TPR) repeat protein
LHRKLIGLGEVFYALNLREDALSTLRQAIVFSPSGGYIQFRIGKLFWERRDFDKAIDAYLKTPNLAIAHRALGKIYEQEY